MPGVTTNSLVSMLDNLEEEPGCPQQIVCHQSSSTCTNYPIIQIHDLIPSSQFIPSQSFMMIKVFDADTLLKYQVLSTPCRL